MRYQRKSGIFVIFEYKKKKRKQNFVLCGKSKCIFVSEDKLVFIKPTMKRNKSPATHPLKALILCKQTLFHM